MNVAVFSDVHGKVLLCFRLVERYQLETGQHIDLILQCGDMGIFPDLLKLDKATVRHAKKDGTELSFHKYFTEPRKDVEEILSETDCNLICVRGNHEDHAFLDNLEQETGETLFPVDCYKRIYVLKSGALHSFVSGNSQLDLLGIGRVGPPLGETETKKAKYIQEYEKEQLSKLREINVDILLTHDSAKDFINTGFGMEEIRMCLDTYKPVYHFFGHTGKYSERKVDSNGFTISVKLSDLKWEEDNRGKVLKLGCFGILRWKNPRDHCLEIVEDNWLREYTHHTWTYL